jgi:hypothetical protein
VAVLLDALDGLAQSPVAVLSPVLQPVLPDVLRSRDALQSRGVRPSLGDLGRLDRWVRCGSDAWADVRPDEAAGANLAQSQRRRLADAGAQILRDR